MARTISSTINAAAYVEYGNGTIIPYPGIAHKRFVLSRSDIVRVDKDSSGWRKPSAYWSYSERDVMPSGVGYFEPGYYGYKYTGNLGSDVYSTIARQAPDFPVGLRSKAEVQALLTLKDQQVNLSQAFAERAQTSRLMAQSLNRIARAVISVKKGLIRGAAELLAGPGSSRRERKFPTRSKLRSASSNMGAYWLELQYGWLPLLSDIHGSCLQLDKNYPPNSYRIRVKGGAKEESQYLEVVKPMGYVPATYNIKDRTECRVRLFYYPKVDALAALGSAGLTNPLYIAWELVPFSFMADWAFPLGNWLNSLDAGNGFTFAGGDRTEYRCREAEVSGAQRTSNHYSVLTGQHRRVRSDRFVYNDPPWAAFPSFKSWFSVSHGANAAALLATTLKGTGSPGPRLR